MPLRRTPLYDAHVRLGARMVEFAGFMMPLQYGRILGEHAVVRERAGLFDVSHMGRLRFVGAQAVPALQLLTSNDVSALAPGQAQYSLMLNHQAGIVDDLIVCRLPAEQPEFLMVVNAVNTAKDLMWIREHGPRDTIVRDVSDEMAMLALQGPKAVGILARLADQDVESLPRFGCQWADVGSIRCLVSRTGYTGEDGFELCCASDEVETLWDCLMSEGQAEGLVPCGLGARDSLRLEACLPLWGNELSEATQPAQARLGWAVKPDKGEFIGREAFLRAAQVGPHRLLCPLRIEGRRIPRRCCPVLDERDTVVGHVTSGTFSPMLQCGIALAYLDPDLAGLGQRVCIAIGRTEVWAEVVKKPFYDSGRRNK